MCDRLGTSALLKVKEAATLLRIHPMTAYHLVQQGKLPAFKVGGQWRVSMDQLRQYQARAFKRVR